MPTVETPSSQLNTADVAFLLPIVRRLGVEQVVWLTHRAGQILAAEAGAPKSADLEPHLKLA